ncbi:T-cell ecto-ADP-ribosyltransferase 2-like [Rhinoderma darwinii]|uniref:T-cell ecto-ADP-ribosyltransferase 2-like n=1 Tax=Rhinoderma darwinii TaxID=43563 RepID=UPI003F674346
MNHWVGSLSVLFAFIMMPTSQEQSQTLDLAEEAFDDQYLGCKRDMENKLEQNDVLQIEKSKNKKFKRAWEEANQLWALRKNDLQTKLPQAFKDDHGIALMTYTSFIREDFNNAARSAGKSYKSYMDNFDFKWLHFYLTAGHELLLQSNLRSRHTVYSGIDDNVEVTPNGSTYVKFGHFLYTSLQEDKSTVMGNKSLLVIHNYPGVNVEQFSQFSCEREVLVPGYEVFSLSPTEVEDVFELNTRKFCSNFNCAYIKGEYSKLSVHECVKAVASSGRIHGTVFSAAVTLLLVVVVTLL